MSGSQELSFFKLFLKKLSFGFLSSTEASTTEEHELGEKGRRSSQRSTEAHQLDLVTHGKKLRFFF